MRGLLIRRKLTNLKRRTRSRNRIANLELEFLAHLTQLRDQILPLTDAQPTQILSLANPTKRGITRLAISLEHAIPQVQRGQKITGRIGIPVMNAVGFLTILIRAFAGILQTQERDHHQHRGQRVRRGRLRCLDDHTAQAHVDWNACKHATRMRQHNFAMLARHSLQLGQFVETIGHRLHIRRIDKAEIRNILRGTSHTHRQHMQHDRAQRRAQNLRLREFRARLKILARIQANRNTIGNTTATTRTLVRARLTDRFNRKPLHLRALRIT